MGIIEKLKLLIKIRKPAGELVGQVKEIKRGWKKVSFWVSAIGTLLSMVAALNYVISPQVSLIINTALTAFYNILRGLDKAEEPGARSLLQSTEFYQGALGEFSNALVQMQTGGINPHWFHLAQTFIAIAMAAAQNLGARQPVPAALPAPAPVTGTEVK